MNRWTYRITASVACWVFLFTVLGGVLVLSAWIGVIESSTHEALREAVLFASGGSLIFYIICVLFYPIIKDNDETNKAFEKLKEKGN